MPTEALWIGIGAAKRVGVWPTTNDVTCQPKLVIFLKYGDRFKKRAQTFSLLMAANEENRRLNVTSNSGIISRNL